MTRTSLLAHATVGFVLALEIPAVSQPLNDDLADATEITSYPTSHSGSNQNATLEATEADCGPTRYYSVWFRLTPPYAGTLDLDTIGSEFDTYLSVWTDDTPGHPLANCEDSDDDSGPGVLSMLDMPVSPTETYYIRLTGYNEDTYGNYTLNVDLGYDCSAQSDIPIPECEALEALYDSTNGSVWATDWLADNAPCGWSFLTCTGGHVTDLVVVDEPLNGFLPRQLGNLDSLKALEIWQANTLQGPIPVEIGFLSKLERLGLWPGLSGPIPASLGQLSNLTYLDLIGNDLSGPIPFELGQLENLDHIGLFGNDLTGAVPQPLAAAGHSASYCTMGSNTSLCLPDTPPYKYLTTPNGSDICGLSLEEACISVRDTVANTLDSGAGSLRQAVSDALPGMEIVFDPSLESDTVALTSGELVIDKDIVISGPGTHGIAISAGSNSRVLRVQEFNRKVGLNRLSFANGFTTASGGGMLIEDHNWVEIDSCRIENNTSDPGFGGGIAIWDAFRVLIDHTTIVDNLADQSGGGIYGAAEIQNSTISGNTCGALGGGLHNGSAGATIVNSTVSGNYAGHDGGGIYDSNGTIQIRNATITDNTGGGVHGGATLYSTIVADNNSSDCTSGTVDGGYNLDSDGTCITEPTSIGSASNVIGSLADNGGPTQTHALWSASPAVDKGDCFAGGLTSDQRGETRPVNDPGDAIPNTADGCDIGSFERQWTCDSGPITVTNANPSGAGSLAEAIFDICPRGTIVFHDTLDEKMIWPNGTLQIAKSLTIDTEGKSVSIRQSDIGGNHVMDVTSDTTWLYGLDLTVPGDSYFNSGTLRIRSGAVVAVDSGSVYGGLLTVGVLNEGEFTARATRIQAGVPAIQSNPGSSLHLSRSSVYGPSILKGNSAISNSTLASHLDSFEAIDNSGTLDLRNSTVTAVAPFVTGVTGVTNTGTLNLFSTLVAADTAVSSPGTLNDLGYNQSYTSYASAGLDPTGLTDNGGATLTVALLPTSPAIDQGDCDTLSTDQRGEIRPFDNTFVTDASDGCDVGAYESDALCEPAITVQNNSDSGVGSLRQAIVDICHGGSIDFAPALSGQTITLTTGQLVVNKDLSIVGLGKDDLDLAGSGGKRIMRVEENAEVEISGLTMRDGHGEDDGCGALCGTGVAGAICNFGDLALSDVEVAGNSTDIGLSGAVMNYGKLNVEVSTFANNEVRGYDCASCGGAISNHGELIVDRSTFSNNLSLDESFNLSASGGAICSFPFAAGGLRVSSSTFSGNSAVGDQSASGGAISASGELIVTHSTITGNSTSTSAGTDAGGGIEHSGPSGFLFGNITAGNVASSNPDVTGQFTSQGFNLIGDVGSATITPGTGDQFGTSGSPVDPLLGVLADNGGTTATHALQSGSPAIDTGDCDTLTIDQRGFPRPLDDTSVPDVSDGCDIGSFESSGIPPLLAVIPLVETPGISGGDNADDTAVWIHPTDRSLSHVIGTDNSGGLEVYDLSGALQQKVSDPTGTTSNNVDLRYHFPLSGKRVALVAVSDDRSGTTHEAFELYSVDETTGTLDRVTGTIPRPGDYRSYGLCMYFDRDVSKYYAIVTDRSGVTRQFALHDDGDGTVSADFVRHFDVGVRIEGCVADDVLGSLYIGEEDFAIWRYGAQADPKDSTRVLVDSTTMGTGQYLVGDIEGLTLYYGPDSTGYLIASSQGNSQFIVYDRKTDGFVSRFHIGENTLLGIDAVTDTDGIDVQTANFGAPFETGLFVAQDRPNDTGGPTNHKFVAWDSIASSAEPKLIVDTSWDARLDPYPPEIGDYVFDDLDGDGVFEFVDGERGIDGITVKLVQESSGMPTALYETTTSNSGWYHFRDAPAGDYRVQFVLPTSLHIFSPADVGDDASDSDVTNTTQGTTNAFTYDGAGLLFNIDAGMIYAPLGEDTLFVRADVLLEGAGDAPMRTTLVANGDLPTTQPYGASPWLYPGTEHVSAADVSPANGIPDFFDAHADLVDWVLVELRTGTPSAPPMTTIERRAGFLKASGAIVDVDGQRALKFPDVDLSACYVVVRHRNHADVMSMTTIDCTPGLKSYDFTDQMTSAYTDGPDPMKSLSGSYGLFAADANADGNIQALDFNEYIAATTSGATGYEKADFNLDGNVQALDFNLYIANTVAGAASQVP